MDLSKPAELPVSPSPRSVFALGGGITGELFRSIDWSKSVLGPVERWPMSLKAVLNLVFNSHEPMVVFWGPERIQFYNDAYLPNFDSVRFPMAMGQRGRECWPEIWKYLGAQIQSVMSTGESTSTSGERMPLYRDGALVEACWSYTHSPLFDDAGRIGGVLVSCTETTDQVETNRLLSEANVEVRAAHAELQTFLLQAPVGIALLSGPEHVFSFVNPAFMNLLFAGKPASQVLNQTVRSAVPAVEGQGVFELLDGVYQVDQPFVGAKLRVTVSQPGGSDREVFVNFSCQARHGPNGKIEGILGVIYEVTDQVNEQRQIERLAQSLREALEARDTFIGAASHELKTPLTALKLQTQLGQRRLLRAGPESVTAQGMGKLLESTLVQVDRLDRLVSDMLDVSSVRTGKLVLNRTLTDLSALMYAVMERFTPQLEVARCPVTLTLQPGVEALVDASRVEQVVTNFITNVLKYAAGTPVHACVARDGGLAKVSLRDHGEGIAPRNQQRIFERFERAAAANQVTGLGLGLYIAKQIIEEHGGRIYVQSTRGQGAEFGFELPLVLRTDGPP